MKPHSLAHHPLCSCMLWVCTHASKATGSTCSRPSKLGARNFSAANGHCKQMMNLQRYHVLKNAHVVIPKWAALRVCFKRDSRRVSKKVGSPSSHIPATWFVPEACTQTWPKMPASTAFFPSSCCHFAAKAVQHAASWMSIAIWTAASHQPLFEPKG